MGLREKVALLLIAVAFQTACLECKPQYLKQNPFERHVGSRGNGKCNAVNNIAKSSHGMTNNNAQREILTKPNIYKTYNFPEVDYPSDPSPRQPSSFSYGSERKSLNKMCDPALLDSFKKEARKNRKSKKQVSECTPIHIQIKDPQPLYVNDKGSFPEVEYPLNAMDTWTPKYWNSLPYNLDNSFTPQTEFGPQNQANNKQKIFNRYEKSTNMKQNMFAAAKSKENKKKELNFMNLGSYKNNKIIAPVKIKTKLKKDNLTNTTVFNFPPGHKIRRKHKKRRKSPASRHNLNNNRKKLTKCLKPHPRSGILFENKIPDSNKNICLSEYNTSNSKSMCVENILNKTMPNITTTSPSPNSSNDGVIKQRLFPSSSNIDNFDPLQLAQLSTSDLRDLAEKVLALIGPIPNEYEIPAPDFFTLDNLAIHDILPENISDLSLVSKYLISPDNINEKMSKYPSQSHISEITALYYLVERVLEQIGSQQNNYDAPNDITAVKCSSTLPTEYIPNSSVPVKVNDLSITTLTDYVLPDPSTMSYNNTDDKSMTNSMEQADISFVPENHTTRDSFPFCPLPSIDQCSIYNSTEANSSNKTDLTLTEIQNESTLEKVSEKPGSLVRQNDNFKKKQSDSDTLTVSKDSNIDHIPNYRLSDEDTVADIPQSNIFHNMTDNKTSKEMVANGTLEDMPVNNALSDKSEYDASSDKPINKELEDISVNDTLSDMRDYETLVNEPDNNNLEETQEDTSSDIPEYETLSDIPDNKILENLPDNDKFEETSEYDTLPIMSESETLSDIPDDKSLEDFSDNENSGEKPEYDTMSDISNNNTTPVMLENETLENSTNNDKLEDSLENDEAKSEESPGNTYNEILNDSPDNKTLSNISQNDIFTDIPDNNKSEGMPEYDTMSDVSNNNTIPVMLGNETLENSTDNDKFEETSECDTLPNMSESETLSDIPDDNALEELSENEKSEETPEYEEPKYEGSPDILYNEILKDSPENETLSDNMSQNDTFTDRPDNNKLKDMKEYDTMSDVSNNNTIPIMLGNATLENSQDNDKFDETPEYDTSPNMSESETLTDIPNNEALEDFSDNENSGEKPEYDTMSDISNNNTTPVMLENETLENSTNNDKLEDSLENDEAKSEESPGNTYNEILNDSPDNKTLSNISQNDIFTDIPDNNKSEGMPEYDSMSDVSNNNTIPVMLGKETLENSTDNDKFEETSECDTLPNMSESETLSDIPDTETLENSSDNVKSEKMTEYYTLSNMPEHEMSDISDNETLEDLSENEKSKETSEYDMPKYDANTGANDFDIISDLSESELPKFDITDTGITSEIFDTDTVRGMPFVEELFDMEPNINKSDALPGLIEDVSDTDDLLDALLELLIADLTRNMLPDTEALPSTSDTALLPNMTNLDDKLPIVHTPNASPSHKHRKLTRH